MSDDRPAIRPSPFKEEKSSWDRLTEAVEKIAEFVVENKDTISTILRYVKEDMEKPVYSSSYYTK